MNHGTCTCGVVKGAVSAYTPGTGLRRVLFAVAIRDSHHESSVWNCEAEGDPAWLDLLEAQAQPGAGMVIDYELATRPFKKRSGGKEFHAGEIRFLRVMKYTIAPRWPGRATSAAEPEPEAIER